MPFDFKNSPSRGAWLAPRSRIVPKASNVRVYTSSKAVFEAEHGGSRALLALTAMHWTGVPRTVYAIIMTIHTDAIYEAGVLRPLTPLGLQEHQVVSISISTTSDQAEPVRDHSAFLNSYAPEDEGLYDDYSDG